MQTLFTAWSILVIAIVTGMTVLCVHHAAQAAASEKRLQRKLAELLALGTRIGALEAAHESLRKQHESLRGKFYAMKSKEEQQVIDFGRPDNYPPTAPGLYAGPTLCDNWTKAQIEGPKSEAALCVCTYCLTARAARAQSKAAILAARATAKANGSE